MPRSLAVLLIAAMVVMVSTSAMAAPVATWQVTAVNDLPFQVNDIELTLAGTGGGITGPIAVIPNPVAFSAPPPGNELNASWAGALITGQSFTADFNLTVGLTPSLAGGTWTFNSAVVGPVNPALTSFTPVGVPEPSSIVLACLAAAGLAVTALRRRKR